MTNKIEVSGTVKWEPKVWPARNEDQSDVVQFSIEYEEARTNRKSVFNCKGFYKSAEKLTAACQSGDLDVGTHIKVSGKLIEEKWKDKKTDEWVNRVTIHVAEHEILEPKEPTESAASSDDDIPF